jgi:hypothetical protein
LSFLKLISAIIIVFQIRQVALTCDLNRLEAAVRSLTREKGDSTTLEAVSSSGVVPQDSAGSLESQAVDLSRFATRLNTRSLVEG